MASRRLIRIRTENNKSLKISYKGCSDLFSSKWNIKIYNSGTVVCTDLVPLRKYAVGKFKLPDPSLKLIKCDDSGWGFPLCGILIGLEFNRKIYVGEIGVEYFKSPSFEKKEYLKKYSDEGIKILNKKIGANPKTHRIEICTGYVNGTLRDDLRELGYDVRTVEITGLLQNKLEIYYKMYIKKKTGVDLAYDPKEVTKKQLVFEYHKALEWGQKYAPHLLKSGWQSMKDKGITG